MSADQQADRWDRRMRDIAAAFDYPATPNLAARLRAERMAALASQQRARLAQRAAFAVLALVVLCAALLIVPPVRAAIVNFLRIGAVQITLDPTPTPIPTPTIPATPATPIPTPRPLGSVLDLAGETTLAAARQQVGFPIRLPTYPSDLGAPDAVFVQDLGDQTVMLVWLDPTQPRRVRLALQVLGRNAWVEKFQPRVVGETRVNGNPAVWAVGEYLLKTQGGNLEQRRLITGNVLIWKEGDLTYRLETDLPMEEAVKIAESLR